MRTKHQSTLVSINLANSGMGKRTALLSAQCPRVLGSLEEAFLDRCFWIPTKKQRTESSGKLNEKPSCQE